MNLLAPISSIMTKNVRTVDADDSLTVVEELLNDLGIHHVPVLDEGKLVGIISKTDFLLFRRGFFETGIEEKFDKFRLRNHTARDIMTRGLAKLAPTDKINVALEVFKKNTLHALLITEKDKLVGIITTHDIIARLAEDKSAVNEYVIK